MVGTRGWKKAFEPAAVIEKAQPRAFLPGDEGRKDGGGGQVISATK